MMRVSLNNIYSIIWFSVLAWLNARGHFTLVNVPHNHFFEISTYKFFRLHPLIRFRVFPHDRVNITLMHWLSKSQLGLQWFLIEIFWCLCDLWYIKNIHLICSLFDRMWPACKHFFIIGRGSYGPYFWVAIIKRKDCLLVDAIGVLWKVDQMNFVLSLKTIRPQNESMILCICHHRTHTPALISIIKW